MAELRDAHDFGRGPRQGAARGGAGLSRAMVCDPGMRMGAGAGALAADTLSLIDSVTGWGHGATDVQVLYNLAITTASSAGTISVKVLPTPLA
jgi:hypothetical protein